MIHNSIRSLFGVDNFSEERPKDKYPTGASKMDHMIFLPSWVKRVI